MCGIHKRSICHAFKQNSIILYTDEIILLDLKQYHTFIRSYQDQLKGDLYGCLPYELGWTSAACIAKDEHCFVLYHESNHRFYRYTDKGV